MKKLILSITIVTLMFGCKSEKKTDQIPSVEVKKETPLTKSDKFESRLLDLRGLKQQFTESLKVKKFGMKYVNDSTYAFVLNLDPSTLDETVEKYSFGIRGFSQESETPFRATFSPKTTILDNEKYLILRKKIKNIKHFDSLDIYIYERANWKKSGRLGGIKVRDILFEKE